MRAALPTLIALLLTTGAATAEQWYFDPGSVPIAYVDNGVAQFQFACRGGDLAMGYWVRSPSRTVAGAGSMNLAMVPDAKSAAPSIAGASFAQDMPLIHGTGTMMVVRGPVARQWARIARRAKTTIRVAFVHRNARGGLDFFNRSEFGASGSSAAIGKVLERCG